MKPATKYFSQKKRKQTFKQMYEAGKFNPKDFTKEP